ncbi:MAG: signal peptidase II [Clostridia bacterium]|nr:signal peptidase II [Clostridia bacterium]
MLEKLKKLKLNISWKSLILVGACVALIIVDLLTKIFEERDHWNFVVIPHLIEVESGSRNPGCAFSFLANAAWGQTFLIVATFIMLALLIALFIVLPERFLLIKIAVTLIAAGAIGNLIDRIAFQEVRDFVGINMFGSMVSCNFADFWIVFGTVVAVIDILFLNEWALIPLTKTAKEAQKKHKKEEHEKTQQISETKKDGNGDE